MSLDPDPIAAKLWCDIYCDVHHELMTAKVDAVGFRDEEVPEQVSKACATQANLAVARFLESPAPK